MRQRVVLYFQSASRELSETNVGENVVVSLVDLLICSHTKGNLHKHTPRLQNLNQSLKGDSAASYQPRSCHMIMVSKQVAECF